MEKKIFSILCAIGTYLSPMHGFENIHQKMAESLANPALTKLWQDVVENGIVTTIGSDENIRPYFVTIQRMLEDVLSEELQEKNLRSLQGFIHTLMPSTVFCIDGDISPDLVSSDIAADPLRLATVHYRAAVLRNYLTRSADLYIAYPRPGLFKRSPQQQVIYAQSLQTYQGHLFDRALDCEDLPDDLIGATYIFEDLEGNMGAFSIQMTQANDPKQKSHFALWFGPLSSPVIQKRVETIIHFIIHKGHLYGCTSITNHSQ